MRVHFADEGEKGHALYEEFSVFGHQYGMVWKIQDGSVRPKVVILVSKIGHCLNDLLYRYSSGFLHADIRAVVSNHRDFEVLTENHQIPFHYLPVTSGTKEEQEINLLGSQRRKN